MSSHPGAAPLLDPGLAATHVAGRDGGVAGLVPAPPGRTIPRPALDAKLDAASARRLTVLCAGAGWGKTIAVSRWVANRPSDARPVAWVTVQAHHDDAASFWQEVIEAIRSAARVGPEHPLSALSASAGVPEEVMASILQALDALPLDVLLVLDDFHETSDPRILDSVARLAQRAMRINVVVLTRVVPALRHHRLRVAGELAELTADDLAFTQDEVRQLARMQGLALSSDQAADLVVRTEGWPVGVQLALLHAARHGVGELASFAGTQRSVAEYLLAEVLERNSPQVREFLLWTSVVQPVSADLAAAVVPGPPGQQILEDLEAHNEFVSSLGPDRAWFRYHPLLRDVLEHELRRDDPDGFRAAHRRAARWWAGHDDPIEAIGHALTAGDRELVGRIYTSAAGPALVGARRDALRACLSAVPPDAEADSVQTILESAGLAFLDGRTGALSALLDVARAELAQGAVVDPPAAVLLELLTVGAHRFAGDAAATERAASQAVRMLDAADPFPAAHGYRTAARHSLGVGRLWSGDPAAADVELRSLLSSTREPAGVDLVLLAARSNLALTTVALGRLRQAEQLARATLEHAAARGWTSLLQARGAHLALAWLYLLRGEWDRAGAAIASGLAAVEGGAEPPATLLLQCLQVEDATARGRLRASRHAARLVRESFDTWRPQGFLPEVAEHALTAADLADPEASGASPRPGPLTMAQTPMGIVCRARRLFASGRRSEIPALVAPVTEWTAPETVVDLIAVLEAWLLTALVHDRDGRTAAALAALDRAVRLASPQDLAHVFLTTGSPRLRPMLHQLGEGSRDDAAFVARLVGRLGGAHPSGPEPEPLVEPLTQRELAMLHALPTLKSNGEIAADAYVSINTVKAHLKGLYRKLGVSSRRGAVERARELGLLP